MIPYLFLCPLIQFFFNFILLFSLSQNQTLWIINISTTYVIMCCLIFLVGNKCVVFVICKCPFENEATGLRERFICYWIPRKAPLCVCVCFWSTNLPILFHPILLFFRQCTRFWIIVMIMFWVLKLNYKQMQLMVSPLLHIYNLILFI